MNVPKKTRSHKRTNASSGFTHLGKIMDQKNQLWQAANLQIAHLANIKNAEVRRRQVVMICETLRLSLRGCMA